jgi:hypothetical protein
MSIYNIKHNIASFYTGKLKSSLCSKYHAPKANRGHGNKLLTFLNWALDGDEWSASTMDAQGTGGTYLNF